MIRKRVFVAGHTGMVGSALVRLLQSQKHIDLVLKTSAELDLVDQQAVVNFFEKEKIDSVYMAAAKVGGIKANNTYPADFIYQNLMIQCNVIHAAHLADIQQLLFLGSSCIYPKLAVQPIVESELLTNSLEPTNEPYAIAKIAGLKLCESYNRQYGRDYRSVMPTNLYGINDNFHLDNAHVIPALIHRFHQAKLTQSPEVMVWGSGKAMREFLCVDDLATACIFVMNLQPNEYLDNTTEMQSHINIGTGKDCTIKSLAQLIAKVVGYQGSIILDNSKPDGTPRKLLNVSKLETLGWKSTVSLEQGLKDTYQWFLKQDIKDINAR
jgi:GDP-L-fucose synthase